MGDCQEKLDGDGITFAENTNYHPSMRQKHKTYSLAITKIQENFYMTRLLSPFGNTGTLVRGGF